MQQEGRDQICNFPESFLPQQMRSTFGQRTKIQRNQNPEAKSKKFRKIQPKSGPNLKENKTVG